MQAGALEGKRVLIAEDCWHIAFALKMTLESEGARVIGPAASLKKARRLLEDDEVDVALVDVNLRGELAYPLLEALAARGVKSVVLSGYQDLSGLGHNTVAVLGKPVQPTQLLRAMRRAVVGTA